MMAGLQGRVVVVTGASRGIGLGVARGFAQAGAVLHLLAEDAAIGVAAAGLGAQAHLCDITDADAVTHVAASIGKIDVLVNNAGLERLTPLDDAGAENASVFRRVLEVNVVGTFLMTRAMLPNFASDGCIINTASTWGRVAEPLFGAYVASKHAVIGLTKTWSRELGPRGIRCNAVAPGWVRTEGSLRSLAGLATRAGKHEEALMETILQGQSLSGLMQPDDVAGPYLFLASPLAANITGQTLGIDRGEVPW